MGVVGVGAGTPAEPAMGTGPRRPSWELSFRLPPPGEFPWVGRRASWTLRHQSLAETLRFIVSPASATPYLPKAPGGRVPAAGTPRVVVGGPARRYGPLPAERRRAPGGGGRFRLSLCLDSRGEPQPGGGSTPPHPCRRLGTTGEKPWGGQEEPGAQAPLGRLHPDFRTAGFTWGLLWE